MRLPLIAVLAVSALASGSVFADIYSPPAPNAVPSGGTSTQQEAYCNTTCSALVNGKGQILGLDGTAGWTVADDLWCANHGSQTNPLVGPSPIPNASPPPSVSCPVTLIPGDTSCNTTIAEVAHCQWHNGQLEQQCEAYEAAKQADVNENAILALDIAATGICGGACAANAVGPGLQAACRDAGLVASTTELIETLSMQGSAMSKAISSVMGVAGIGKELLPVLEGSSAKSPQTASQSFLGKGPAPTGAKPKRMKNAACTSAVMFAAMSGMRYENISADNTTVQDACNAVEQLASAASTVSSGGMLIPNNLGGGAGSTGATETADGTGATETGSSALNCVGAGGTVSSCTATTANTADVAALDSSGLGTQLAPAAEQMLPNMPSSGAGDAANQAASSAGAPSDIAGALSTVASLSEDHPQALFDKVGAMSGGGSGGGGAAGGTPANPMAEMLAGLLGKKGDSAPTGGVAVFQGSSENHDIYHTNSPDNLFQIISGRIQKDSSKLQ